MTIREEIWLSSIIRVSAVVIRRADGKVLTVRKRGTSKLMLPGGKPEPGETARGAAIREFSEELGITLNDKHLREVGVFTSRAANEPGHELVASVFEHPYVDGVADITPLAEIEHLEWVDPEISRDDMAPLNTDVVFPLLHATAQRAPERSVRSERG